MALNETMKIETGNAHDAETKGTGWFVGFSDWTRKEGSALLHVPKGDALTALCVKWYDHPSGDDSGNLKPVSEGRSLSILVSEDSAFRIEFSPTPDFLSGEVQTVLLERHGDFAAWGEGLYHRWHCLSRATVLTIRWNPATAAAKDETSA
ncbi:signal peptidase i [Geoanaerobacter pelophilus]|uniref:Signal peptidase i n=1 Tax=Geoanaerobacter pelophilus TaxID=60036 RepID=A0ABQ0MG09_9BACT|nr:signal peptidase i [Geoanaerobacter pelophilus]